MKIKFVTLGFSVIFAGFILVNKCVARRIIYPPLLLGEVIERNVAQWLDCGLPYGVISEIDGVKLKKPLIVVKKQTRKSTFYRHIACKLLEEYFINKGIYTREHIPAPVVDGEGVYYYIFVEGEDHRSITAQERGEVLPEWNEFVSAFSRVGFYPQWDTSREYGSEEEVNNIVIADNDGLSWYRVDFEFFSFPSPGQGGLDRNELWENFIAEHHTELKQVLGEEKYELLLLSINALYNFGKIPSRMEKRFRDLFFRYQRELLAEYFPSR